MLPRHAVVSYLPHIGLHVLHASPELQHLPLQLLADMLHRHLSYLIYPIPCT